MVDLEKLYDDIKQTSHTNELIEKLIDVGKPTRAKIAVMEFAREQNIYLNTEQAEAILDKFRETDLTPSEQTRAHFPTKDVDLGLDRHESIADPAHRTLPPSAK